MIYRLKKLRLWAMRIIRRLGYVIFPSTMMQCSCHYGCDKCPCVCSCFGGCDDCSVGGKYYVKRAKS